MFGVLVPQGGGDPIPLKKEKLLLGRRRDSCDIALEFPNVSSRHCELELQDGYWLVRDLDSSNGTKVNGVRVRAKWLMPGDLLTLARHRYRIDYDVEPGAPPPPPIDDGPDGDILGTSLMEKAGLVHRRPRPDSQRPSTASRNASPTGPAAKPRDDDDRIMDWLNDDEG